MNEDRQRGFDPRSRFEQLIFALTRYFALGGAILVIVGILALTIALLLSRTKTSVDYADVAKELKPVNDTTNEGTTITNTPGTKLVLPSNVKAYLQGENEYVLQGWIQNLSKSQQRDFLNNLSKVIAGAEADHANVLDVINTYKTLKLAKLNQIEADKYTTMAFKVACISGIIGLLLILSILSLVLVMLAIERNTRPMSANSVSNELRTSSWKTVEKH